MHSDNTHVVREFMSKSKATTMTYIPYTLGLNGHLQVFIYLMVELVLVKLLQPLKYERELFELADGGTIAL